jgi:hypothetical protein
MFYKNDCITFSSRRFTSNERYVALLATTGRLGILPRRLGRDDGMKLALTVLNPK